MWCIVGCDPDVGGALAVITGDDVGNVETVRIFDCPTKPVDVNGKARTRVCVDGMVELVRELDLPAGTIVLLEVGGGRSLYASQSCFVQGAASGQWLGVLVSHDLDVRLVAASTWKWALKLARRGEVREKNASRELAKRLFANERNQVAAALKRVKDHGRAEALLIAAHGHWAEGRDDSLATLVQAHITKAELRRAREAPIVIESGRSGTIRTAAGLAHFFQTKEIPYLYASPA
jgi:hypothetical protein